jgi:hypothetical protein
MDSVVKFPKERRTKEEFARVVGFKNSLGF